MDRPTVTAAEMRAVDERAQEYGVTVERLMENAGYQVADLVRAEFGGRVAVYAGPGNNGGDGLVAARRLHGWGFDVAVVLATREMDGPAGEALATLERLDVPLHDPGEEVEADVAVDALLGLGLDGPPREPFDRLVAAVNSADRVVAVDVPTGVDADTGEVYEPHVDADATVTLALPKQGLLDCPPCGDLHLADIGVPPAALRDLGIDPPRPFADRSRVRL